MTDEAKPNVINLAGKRPPVSYTLHLTEFWDGRVQVTVEGVADDDRSREALASSFAAVAAAWLTPKHVHQIMEDMIEARATEIVGKHGDGAKDAMIADFHRDPAFAALCTACGAFEAFLASVKEEPPPEPAND